MDLSRFDTGGFERGRPIWVEALWLLVQALFIGSWLPGSAHRVWLLRAFGAHVGCGVVLKPHLRIKFPWRLSLGEHVWLGEGVWIDNLAPVKIGSHVCISQGAYLCTGSHDWGSPTFDLIVRPIRVADHAWICSRATLAPGTVVGEGAVVALGAVASGVLSPWQIYASVPAGTVRARPMPAHHSCYRDNGPTKELYG